MAEVTIKGAGIIGLSIAWECIQRGAKVQVIDHMALVLVQAGVLLVHLRPMSQKIGMKRRPFNSKAFRWRRRFGNTLIVPLG